MNHLNAVQGTMTIKARNTLSGYWLVLAYGDRVMNTTKITVACLFLMLTTTSFSQSKGWRGIVPLHSTCEDTKRLLGITKCETNSYDLKDARVFIWFSKKPCVDGWNVPPGTVTSIEVFPKNKLYLTDLSI